MAKLGRSLLASRGQKERDIQSWSVHGFVLLGELLCELVIRQEFFCQAGAFEADLPLIPSFHALFHIEWCWSAQTWFVSARSVLAGAHNLLPLLRGINPQRQTRDTQK